MAVNRKDANAYRISTIRELAVWAVVGVLVVKLALYGVADFIRIATIGRCLAASSLMAKASA